MNCSVVTMDRSAQIKLVAAEIARLGGLCDHMTGFQAARAVAAQYPELGWGNGEFMVIAETCGTDPDLRRELEAIREARGEIGFGWTKREFLEDLKRRANADRIENKDRFTAMKLYADVAGFVPEKGGPVVNVQTNVGIANNVMHMPEPEPLDEWEAKTVKQQSKLIEHASG